MPERARVHEQMSCPDQTIYRYIAGALALAAIKAGQEETLQRRQQHSSLHNYPSLSRLSLPARMVAGACLCTVTSIHSEWTESVGPGLQLA